MNSNIENKSIDFLTLAMILKNRWLTIVSFIALSVTLSLVYYFLVASHTFKAITPISLISSEEMAKYDELNRQGLFLFQSGNITPDMKIGREIAEPRIIVSPSTTSEITISDIFKMQIQNPSFLVEQFHKTKLLDVDKFKTEAQYRMALGQLASEMNVVAPDLKKASTFSEYKWKIEVEFHDKERWFETLNQINIAAKEKTRQFILDKFDRELEILKSEKNRKIALLDNEIESKIFGYEKSIDTYLAVLSEQAQIAKNLNIVGVAEANSQNKEISNLFASAGNSSLHQRLYLLGENAIKQEIRAIKSRKSHIPFVPGIAEIEQRKFQINAEAVSIIAQTKKLIEQTPLASQGEFSPVNIQIDQTRILNSKRLDVVIVLSAIIGAVLGLTTALLLYMRDFQART